MSIDRISPQLVEEVLPGNVLPAISPELPQIKPIVSSQEVKLIEQSKDSLDQALAIKAKNGKIYSDAPATQTMLLGNLYDLDPKSGEKWMTLLRQKENGVPILN